MPKGNITCNPFPTNYIFLMLNESMSSMQTNRQIDRERGRQTGHVSGGESGILWGLIDSILWANDLPRALGRNDETSLHDTVTLPMSRCHLHLSVFSLPLRLSLSLSVFLSTSLCLFLGEMHRFTFVCTVTHTYSTVTARNRVHQTDGADLE